MVGAVSQSTESGRAAQRSSNELSSGDDFSSYDHSLFDNDKKKITYFSLFRYSDTADIIMLVVGVICSCVVGITFPLNLLIINRVINGFVALDAQTKALETMNEMIKWYVLLGSLTLLLAFLQMFCFSLSAKRQGRRIRLKLFQQILRQDIGWFDQQTMGDLITKLTSQVDQIETGIGDRLGRFLQNLVMFISCFVSAFNNQWKLALVGLSTTPVIVIAFTILGLGLSRYSTKEDKEYSLANSIASEVLVSIRTVFAFIGQEKEAARYNANLGAAAKVSLKKNLVLGFGVGLISFSIFSSSGLTFWYGIKLITEGDTSVQGGTIVSVVLAFLVGSIALGLVLPEFAFFTRAASAAKSTFWIIERIPPIDKDQPGEIIENFKGRIEFKNVTFRYPTRPTMTTLNNLSIKVRPGQTVAIVGPSGSGKSTTIQLIQRFYNAESGEILIDGKDIRTLDLVWLRKQIGVVQQEPTLFSGTVAENIAFGLPGATEQEIEAAAKMADAHDFILKLPQAYQTSIVEGGGGMSGGQKQRIAIARALIRNPKILLLDEATSALDTRSERAVQMALDRARTGRTVIMVAHRLTTVRDANKIVVMDRGQVMEIGNHDQLVALNGIYAHMLSTQDKPDSESDTERESDEEGNIDQSLGMSKEEMRKRNVWMRSKRYSEVESVLETLSETSSSIKTSKEKNVLLRAVKLNRPEFPFLFAGLFFSLLSGLSQPGFSILYSQMFGIFSMNNTAQEKLNETSFYSGMMALLGFLQFVVQVLSGGALGYAGSRLIKRARSLLFSALLRQEIGWFDRVENSPGILTARLATEVSCLETVTGVQLGTLMEAISLITASLVIGFVNSWALSLVNLCFAPILVISSALQMNHLKASIGRHEVAGSQVVQEALSAEKTVTSFGLESHFYEKFRKRSAPAPSARYKEALMFAVVHSIASSLLYYQAGSTFYVGAVLLSKGQLTTLAIFRSFAAFNFGSQALGRVASLAPGFKKASHDVRLVFATMDRKTKSDVNAGDFPDEPFDGRIEFRNVYFRYPTRPNTRILRRFSHTVEAGQSVALVGQSGCGKSTLLQLVQRLYDASNHGPDSGIFMNGRDVRTLAPNWIRKQIGIVSQEPNLFDLTIRENIAYGDNSREVSMEEIIAAAKKANAHSFIETLPEGYETNVGQGGSQLSGGQKQRVAIARAIIREPRILLLDEATSALDNESERVVQAALDAAMAGGNRTSLVVAHRLTTVENCDMIVVLQEGQKVESGPPSALMKARGVFYTLHNVDAAVN
uniref:ABC transporter domain-containing protein n=3 Tax=Mesocestoides corti TaxID=53468 RepID=A0A5K3EJJ9_MESCO